jgi:hypothetical protein
MTTPLKISESKTNGKGYEVHIHEDANHGFHNDSTLRRGYGETVMGPNTCAFPRTPNLKLTTERHACRPSLRREV